MMFVGFDILLNVPYSQFEKQQKKNRKNVLQIARF